MSTLHQQYQSAQGQDPVCERLDEPGVLAVISFTGDCNSAGLPGLIPVGLPTLSGQELEVIRYGNGPALRGADDGCEWSETEEVLCAATWITATECADIEAATEAAYTRLFRLIQRKGFPYPFRIWNFIPNINRGEGDLEEYKKFCVGRERAFSLLHVAPNEFPAASALGHHNRGAVIYMLASRHSGTHHENPRQQPAYCYPRQYGPASPSFARATSISLQRNKQIFVSGTASIIGHDTKATDNLEGQLTITLENISSLLESTALKPYRLSSARVYLRRTEDLDATKNLLRKHWGDTELNFLHADICRGELLVEIEAVAESQVE